MIKKHFPIFLICYLVIVAIAGCDSTTEVDPNNLQMSIVAAPSTVLTGEYSSITATLNNVNTSVSTGTSATTTTPVSGYAVAFKITQNASNCVLTVVNNITDASGNATAIYQPVPLPAPILSRPVLIPVKPHRRRLL